MDSTLVKDVVLVGVKPGQSPALVAAHLAGLMGITDDKAVALLRAAPVVVKRGITEAEGVAYLEKMAAVGAEVMLRSSQTNVVLDRSDEDFLPQVWSTAKRILLGGHDDEMRNGVVLLKSILVALASVFVVVVIEAALYGMAHDYAGFEEGPIDSLSEIISESTHPNGIFELSFQISIPLFAIYGLIAWARPRMDYLVDLSGKTQIAVIATISSIVAIAMPIYMTGIVTLLGGKWDTSAEHVVMYVLSSFAVTMATLCAVNSPAKNHKNSLDIVMLALVLIAACYLYSAMKDVLSWGMDGNDPDETTHWRAGPWRFASGYSFISALIVICISYVQLVILPRMLWRKKIA